MLQSRVVSMNHVGNYDSTKMCLQIHFSTQFIKMFTEQTPLISNYSSKHSMFF